MFEVKKTNLKKQEPNKIQIGKSKKQISRNKSQIKFKLANQKTNFKRQEPNKSKLEK